MKMRLLLISVLLSFWVAVWPGQADATVTDDVKKVVDEVVHIVSNKELKKPHNEEKRRTELKKAIGSIFDYGELTGKSIPLPSRRNLNSFSKHSWNRPMQLKSRRTITIRSST